MADHPAEYIGSSYRANAQGAFSDLVTPHNCYLALAAEGSDRRSCYRELFAHELDNQDIHAIRNAAQFSMPLGSVRFMKQIADALERSLGYAKRGRPRVKKGRGIANDLYLSPTPLCPVGFNTSPRYSRLSRLDA